MPYKSAAEKAFDNRLEHLLQPQVFNVTIGGEPANVRRWARPTRTELVTLFQRYGYYLELIGGDVPVGRRNLYYYPTPPKKEQV